MVPRPYWARSGVDGSNLCARAQVVIPWNYIGTCIKELSSRIYGRENLYVGFRDPINVRFVGRDDCAWGRGGCRTWGPKNVIYIDIFQRSLPACRAL